MKPYISREQWAGPTPEATEQVGVLRVSVSGLTDKQKDELLHMIQAMLDFYARL